MIIEQNVSLANYTTFKMGGIAKTFYLPESEEELISLIHELTPPFYIIGGGSNLLINDNRVFPHVISLRKFNTVIKDLGNGQFYIGASVNLQMLIKSINEKGYGGIEFLYSVPGLVGGAVVMNAGRGNSIDEIGNYVKSVRFYKDGFVSELTKDECLFAHRSSIFKQSGYVILGVTFEFEKGSPTDFESKRKDRINYVRLIQDNSKPNFGSVFSRCNSRIMQAIKVLSPHKNGVHYSHKTSNWLLNEDGTFEEALSRIKKVQSLHRLFCMNCELEVVIWQ